MLSKMSVRKPYTVLVAVILIIVLGIISFRGMETDLLPTLDLPYVVVVTSYPGASPEKVEQSVTRPLEAALGTSSGLDNLSSVSNENVSIIILEYVQSSNMDSVMIELSGTVDMASANFEDAVGSPMLMKISPEMLPIVVASVDYEGMSVEELSAFASETVIPTFERIDGVASVSPEGMIEKRIEIKLNPMNIKSLNDTIQKEIESKFDETQKQLDEAMAELQNGQATLTDETKSQTSKLGQAGSQLNNAIANLNAILAEETLLESNKAVAQAEKAGLEQMLQMFSGLLPSNPTPAEPLTADQIQELIQQWRTLFPEGIAGLTATEIITRLAGESGTLPPELANMSEEQLSLLLDQAIKAPGRIAELDMELQNIDMRMTALSAMKPQLQSALDQANSGYSALESGKMTASIELAKAQIQIQNGQTELETALAEFEKAKTEALSKLDLNAIVTEDMLKNILFAQNFSMPAGYLVDGEIRNLVKVGDSFATVEEIQDMVIFNMEPIGDILISDIADVSFTDNSNELYSKINGNDGILLVFQKQSTASTAEVSDFIQEEITSLQKQYPGLRVTQLMDQGDYIDIVTGSVLENLVIGGILAILILLLFLRDIRPTIVIAFSIPISLLFAVTLMYFTNVTLNVISLSGLALGVGMLVDNSIVVIENMYRMRHLGVPSAKAAIEGAKEVAGAIFASTLTTICVFLPIVFTEGISRQLFTDMGLTIAYSLTASLIVALTLVPAMGATVLKNVNEKKHGIFDTFIKVYKRMLVGALRYKFIVLILTIVLLGISIFGATVMGTAFIPAMNAPQLSASLKIPEGFSNQEAYALNDEVMNRILDVKDVDTVGVMTGGQSGLAMLGGGGSDNESTFYILLKDKRSMTNAEVEKAIYENLNDLNVELDIQSDNMDLTALGGSGIQINVKGYDLDQLAIISNEVAELLRTVPGTDNVTTGLEDADTETRIIIDKSAAMREGLTVAQVYGEIAGALQTDVQATILSQDDDNFPVVLIKDQQKLISKDMLPYFSFDVTKMDGTASKVFLIDIAEIVDTPSLQSINRAGQSRFMTVSAEIAEGYNIGLVSRDVDEKFENYKAPAGYEVTIEGENEMIQSAFKDLVLMILLAIVFIYLIMVAQFQDLLSPFIVLFTLPLAFTGGLLLLWATGMELSIIALLGFLILAGVVVNNGIVFVSYVNQLKEEGMLQKDALIAAGEARIRPILMTALTTILAMSTMALGLNAGSEIMQPMGIVTIGGLTYATLLTLFVVPILYDLFHRRQNARHFLVSNDDE
ncbi:MAG: MMPL family transporter [Clostridiaceae bacterium]|nr:MMPL family transporter [Clostridiaceae bacterium]